jgi:exodeoxyribonuclease V beta subunit
VRSWKPEAALLEEDDGREKFSALRECHRGFEVTSYTRMIQRQSGHARPSEAVGTDLVETDYSTGEQAGGSDPGGPEYGSALHRIIEKTPFESLRGVGSPEEWQQSEVIAGLVNSSLRYHGIDTRHSGHSARLVYNALTARVVLGEGVLLPGFSSVETCRREVEFLFPYPEEGHHRLDEAPVRDFQIGRGYVKGIVDFLFEHAGKTYLVDWKTDILANYDEASLRRHVEAAYALQSQLYSIGLVRILKAHSAEAYEKLFGGTLFCFIRAMESPGDGRRGILLLRPTREEMLRFERELRESDEYSGAPR